MRKFLPCWIILMLCHGPLTAGAKKHTDKYDHYFKKYSKHYFGVDFDWRWFKAQAIAESALRDTVESWAKAKGIMQLMPDTFAELQRDNPHFADINEPRWNIAAGICYDRMLWRMWKAIEPFLDRLNFTFGSYNAGPGTMQRAQALAREQGHDETLWSSIVAVASEVPRWRHRETLGYVEKIHLLKAEIGK